MNSPEHTDALHMEAGATVNYRVQPAPASGSAGAQAPIPHVLGRFRVLGEIARGGMGVILRAYDPSLDRELAIKLLSPEILADSEAGRRFAQEARVVSHLHHPGIIPVFDAGTLPDGRSYFAMPFVEGRTLSSLLADRPAWEHGLTGWLRVFEQVCEIVAHAHQEGVVHRDLKPANVMVGRFGEVMVMDWGVAAMVDTPSQPTLAANPGGWVFGTPAYMPPEQARGNGETPDRRSDVFGLGAILCEILTGQPPYVGMDAATVTRMAAEGDQKDTARRLAERKADPILVHLARRCMSSDRAERPASGAEVAEEVRDYLAKADRRAHVADKHVLTARERQDRRFVGLLTAVLVLAVTVALAASARGQRAKGTDAARSPQTDRVLTPNQ